MAFGILVVGMLMGLIAAATVVTAEAGLLVTALSYMVVGTLTFVSVVFFAMLCEDEPEDTEAR